MLWYNVYVMHLNKNLMFKAKWDLAFAKIFAREGGNEVFFPSGPRSPSNEVLSEKTEVGIGEKYMWMTRAKEIALWMANGCLERL